MHVLVWWYGFLAAVILFQIVALPALVLKKNDLADVLWGPAFPLSAVVAAHFGLPNGLLGLSLRSKLILLVVSVWAFRLFIHVGLRNLSHRAEDVRYNNWRKQWGKRNEVWRSYLQVFVLQALILYLFLSPVLLSISTQYEKLSIPFFFGSAIWLFGFLFEAIADEQLRRFKTDESNRGLLMTRGLWSWSRHPNYFGEVVQWWGVWLMIADLPGAVVTLISPVGVTYLILKISGVEMLEKLMSVRAGYTEYVAKTSRFFPMPPGKK
jgi:steroid 5-alpha reductase family enzyme